MTTPTVFISYSHKDETWKDRLVNQFGVLQEQDLLGVWDDRRIGAGENWRQEIEQALNTARVAVLLITADFLTSQFILGHEVLRLLQRRDKEGLRIFPVIVKPCVWKRVGWLAQMQVRPKDGKELSGGSDHLATQSVVSVISLRGIAGVGKTALAAHLYHDAEFARSTFPDGKYWLNLRGGDATGEIRALLRELGEGGDLRGDLAELCAQAHSRLAGRRILIVLDNAESLAGGNKGAVIEMMKTLNALPSPPPSP